MPQSLVLVLVHIVFSTKKRTAFLEPHDLRAEVHAYLAATLRGLECQPIRVGGVGDRVHLLTGLSRRICLAELVKNLKTSSTRTMKNKRRHYFAWQSGYGAFSVSHSAKDSVIEYIASQEIHHRKMTFQEEFRTFLHKHGVRFDECYVWD